MVRRHAAWELAGASLAVASACRFNFDQQVPDAGGGERIITLEIQGKGAVISNPPGLACVDRCAAAFVGPVTLTATPAGAHGVAAWGNTTCSGSACTVEDTGDVTIAVDFRAPAADANLAFVTSTKHPGVLKTVDDVDGLAGADRICRVTAASAGLTGMFVAFMSSKTLAVDAISKLGSSRGWSRVDGEVVFRDQAEIAGYQQHSPIDLDEQGVRLAPSEFVWIGGLQNGTRDPPEFDCMGFASAVAGEYAHVMFVSFVNGNYLRVSVGCTNSAHLPCFQIDKQVDLAQQPRFPIGRYAFVTQAIWSGSGVASGDAACQAEADAAGVGGRYVAALATTTESVADRVGGLAGPWRRTDGMAITTGVLGDLFDRPANRAADGAVNHATVYVGAISLTDRGTATCSDWTVFDFSTASTGDMSSTAPFGRTTISCVQRTQLLCLQTP